MLHVICLHPAPERHAAFGNALEVLRSVLALHLGPAWPLPTHLAFLLLFHKITPISIVTTTAVSCSMILGIQPVVMQQKQLLSVLWVSVWQFGLDSRPQPGKSLLLGNRDSATAPGA